MATNKYLDYAGLQHFYEKLQLQFAPISAIVFKSSVDDIASLPALNTQKAGWMYNIKTGGLTTPDFVEGAGHIVADGENIAAVELLTGTYTAQSLAPDADPKALGLYEVDTTTSYYAPVTPATGSEDPSSEGWFEFAVGTPTADPKAEGFFEADGVNFIASEDTTIDAGKTYYTGAVSADTSIQAGKTYYELITEVTYKLTQDRLPATGKTYYKAETVMKWDLMGGVFDLEDRYLEFGDQFPQGPASRLVDGRTFLYMGEDTKIYTKVDTPTGRPNEDGYFELDSATVVTDISTIYNPKQQGLYEEDATDPSAVFYVHSTDVAYDNTKTYYECAFVASTDTTVDPTKIYYTEADQYKKAVIYQYDSTAKDWVAQSSSGTGDLEPITTAEIDELFI
jgi:hypothetical protein